MTNYYPEKPIIPYVKTSVTMPEVVISLKHFDAPNEAKKAAYIMFRMESLNGQKGINNNYIGAQADVGRWDKKWDADINGIVKKAEGRTGKERLFVAFNSYQVSLALLLDRVQKRGIYVGGDTHKVVKMHVSNAEDLAKAYYKEWVEGEANYEPTETEISDIKSMYNQADKIFV